MASKLQFLMYFIISVFSTFLAVACTSDNDVPFPDSEAPSIDFEGSALTRGIVNAADDMSAFDVWGWYSPISGTGTARQVFDATLVSRNGTTWTYDNIQRWQQGNSYQFYAIYPSFDAECGYESASCDQNGTFTINNFDCSKTGDEAVDLMTAVRSVECGTDGYPGKVSMPFQHELAKVNIKATVEGGNAIVTKITFSGMKTGGNYNSASTDRWSDTKSGSFINETRQPLDTKGVDLLGDMLLIPQNVNNDIKLKVEYILDGVQQTPKEFTLPATVEKWEAGKSYRYTITFKGNNIVFTVNVASWNHSTGGIITVE
ncbi:fimbrillin family protein [Phocaeicola coprophilus]|uniref:fimbrillin family protein n=1 Tax=Phocaeicola coprophilus TaxID=387090 RepID=UPI00255C9955|nr:fimbrillin family protein [Phocaeicola coprophilus]